MNRMPRRIDKFEFFQVVTRMCGRKQEILKKQKSINCNLFNYEGNPGEEWQGNNNTVSNISSEGHQKAENRGNFVRSRVISNTDDGLLRKSN